MSAVNAETIVSSNDECSDSDQEDISVENGFKTRRSSELVIGFAGPIGCGMPQVIDMAASLLRDMGYNIVHIKISDFIAAHANTTVPNSLSHSARYIRYRSRQLGGNFLRNAFDESILAQWAASEIHLKRIEHGGTYVNGPKDNEIQRTAYLIDQIKNDSEVRLLRDIYRKLFHLIGVVSMEDRRRQRLSAEGMNDSEVMDLISKDRDDGEEKGQKLEKALKLSDFFLRNDSRNIEQLKSQLSRFFGLLHGKNDVTPTKQEFGMYTAYASGLRSACMSRQVGAAITTQSGQVLSTGCNDVPKAGGGLYSTHDATNDKRCFHFETRECHNDREKNTMVERIVQALAEFKSEDQTSALLTAEQAKDMAQAVLKRSGLKDLTEFSRAVHAEMDAIVSLARNGVGPGTKNSILYTTTFPCHSCARHIIAAGIVKVYYIEPYEKSRAKNLHHDAYAFDVTDSNDNREIVLDQPDSKVSMIHFEGVAPSRYIELFTMPNRKDANGRLNEIPVNHFKVVNEFIDDYFDFENKALANLRSKIPTAFPTE